MSQESAPNRPEGRVKTLDVVASLLRISRGSAYEAAKRKEIPTIRIGRRLESNLSRASEGTSNTAD
jgi:hypothetical protein